MITLFALLLLLALVNHVEVVRHGAVDVKVAVPKAVADLLLRDARFGRGAQNLLDVAYGLNHLRWIGAGSSPDRDERARKAGGRGRKGDISPCCSDVMSSGSAGQGTRSGAHLRDMDQGERTVVIFARVESAIIELVYMRG